MGAYSSQEKIKIVECYLATKSITLAQRNFRSHFKTTASPARNTILSLTEKFLREGTVDNLWAGSTGTVRSARTEKIIQQTRVIIERSPRKPARRPSQELGVSLSSARRIKTEDLGLHPIQDVNSPEADAKKHGTQRSVLSLVPPAMPGVGCIR